MWFYEIKCLILPICITGPDPASPLLFTATAHGAVAASVTGLPVYNNSAQGSQDRQEQKQLKRMEKLEAERVGYSSATTAAAATVLISTAA